LLVDGPGTAATDVLGAVKVIVVTVVVVDDTRIMVDVAVGTLTVVGVVVASLLFEVAAKTVDVAAVTTSVEVVSDTTSASDVVLNLDGAVVDMPSSSEMTTVSWNQIVFPVKLEWWSLVRSMHEHERPIPKLYSRVRHPRTR